MTKTFFQQLHRKEVEHVARMPKEERDEYLYNYAALEFPGGGLVHSADQSSAMRAEVLAEVERMKVSA